MKNNNKVQGWLFSLALLACGNSVAASAEAEQKEVAPVLEEVFVTATKREKSMRDIAASISAFSGKDLEQQAVLSINEVLEQTPGVTSNSARPGDQRIVMRGISTSSNPTSTVPYPVGVFIGDTALNEPYAASITPDLSAFDLAAVEVLKGPQGTLFGGAALSGVLRYRLNDPNPDKFELRYFSQLISPEHGSQAWTHGVVGNIPLLGEGGDLGMRLAYIKRSYPGVTDYERDGVIQKDVNDGEGEQIRLGLLWQPSDQFQAKYSFLKQDYFADNGLVLADSRDGPRQTKGSLLPWINKHEFGLQNLEIQYDWEAVRLVSSTSRTSKKRRNIIDSYAAILGEPQDDTPDSAAIPFATDQESTSWQQELRLQSQGGEKFEWLVGGYYLRSPIRYYLKLNAEALNQAGSSGAEIDQTLSTLGEVLNLAEEFAQALQGADQENIDCEVSVLCAETNARAEEQALFFDVTWHPWSWWELSLGARVYETTVDGGFVGQGVGARIVNNGQSPADYRTEITEDGINPKFSTTFHFSDDHSLYFLVNRGFRFGGIQNIPEDEAQNVPGTYKSDYIWNYELGLRTTWLDGRMELDITGYHIDYTDALVVLKNAIQINYYDNVGSAESDGVEASLRWLTPIPGVILFVTGGTVDAHTTEYFEAGRNPVPAGKPLPGSAEYQYSANLAFHGSPNWPVQLQGLLGYSYVGETYNDIANDDIVNDYATLNMGLNLSMPSVKGKPTLAINAVNVRDETAPVSVVNSAVGDDYYILNMPRTVTARLSLEF